MKTLVLFECMSLAIPSMHTLCTAATISVGRTRDARLHMEVSLHMSLVRSRETTALYRQPVDPITRLCSENSRVLVKISFAMQFLMEMTPGCRCSQQTLSQRTNYCTSRDKDVDSIVQ